MKKPESTSILKNSNQKNIVGRLANGEAIQNKKRGGRGGKKISDGSCQINIKTCSSEDECREVSSSIEAKDGFSSQNNSKRSRDCLATDAATLMTESDWSEGTRISHKGKKGGNSRSGKR